MTQVSLNENHNLRETEVLFFVRLHMPVGGILPQHLL